MVHCRPRWEAWPSTHDPDADMGEGGKPTHGRLVPALPTAHVFRPVNRGGQAQCVALARRWFGSCSRGMLPLLEFRGSHPND